MKHTMRFLMTAGLLALATLATAQGTTEPNKGQSHVADKIASYFANLAGSKDNALALVNALRGGTDVKLVTTTTVPGTGGAPPTTTTTTTTFAPPTEKMGWGNVKISLGLAQDALLRAGITKPTAEQLQIALLGGDLKAADGTTVALKGVLQMRADGMGWGQIAHAGGTKVGPVVSTLKSTQTRLAALPPTNATGTTTPTTTATSASSKGITTAAGSLASQGKGHSKGITTASGATSSASGVVTAEGASAGHQPKANAHGRGIVTGAGTTAGASVAATGGGKHSTAGAGMVTAGGASAAAGVTTAHGNSGDHGKSQAKGKAGG